jgi:hypothetical protein
MSAQQWTMERLMSLKKPERPRQPAADPDLCEVKLVDLQNGKMMLRVSSDRRAKTARSTSKSG